jgi:hypothetical protein
VASAAHSTQIFFIKIIFKIKLKTKAIEIIFNLSFTFQIQANILKLICNKKLKTRNKIEYCKIFQESI